MTKSALRGQLLAAASMAVLPLFYASNAAAQSALPAPDSSETIESVVVTGTRLSSGFSAPTPVTAFSSGQLQQLSPNNIAEAIQQLPELEGSQVTTNAGAVSAGAATNGESLLSLRNLGANRTLVLLDGNRLPYSNTSDSVDTNITIPQTLVQRVDVVTGGASATYGSDAVAGVVNFILDTKYTGFKADLSGGETTYGDGANGHISATYGAPFGDGRGHVIASVEAFEQDGIGLPPIGRSWFDNASGAYPNPVAGASPTTVIVPNVRSSVGTYGGVITAVQGCSTPSCKALVDTQFLAGGATAPFNPGTQVGTSFSSGGDGSYVVNGLSPMQHRYNAFVHAEYDLEENLTWFAEGNYGLSHTTQIGAPPFEYGSRFQFTIYPTNPNLPANIASVFAANPTLTSFNLGRFSADLPPITNDDRDGMMRFATGLKGSISSRWTFDTNLSYARAFQFLDQSDTINRNLYAAADAVISPTTGQVVCRSTLSGLDPGCVPINLFGPNSISPAGAAYVDGVDHGDTVFHQTAFNANVRGDLGDKIRLAAPISVAFGMAYRRDDANRTVNALSDIYTSCTGVRGCPASLNNAYGGYQSYNPGPLKGSVSATEGYGELGIPIVKDLPFVQSFDLDLAGRMTDYSISGVTYTWKTGANWAVDDSLRIRGTLSQDIRAPSLTELFSPGTSATNTGLYPASNPIYAGTPAGVPTQAITEGNPNLKPEEAHTSTAGAIYTPSWLPGLQTSLDYYHINISGAIASISEQNVINGCYQGNASYCALITINNGTPITSTTQISSATTGLVVKSITENLQSVATSGLDFEAAYGLPMFDGTLTSRVIGNYLLSASNSAQAAGDTLLVGSNGGNWPLWTGTISADFEDNLLGAFIQERLIANGHNDPNLVTGVSITNNNVPLIAYTDVNLVYKFQSYFGSSDELYFNVTNLFNQSPPVTVTGSSSFENPTNFSLYDVLGRRFVAGLRIKL